MTIQDKPHCDQTRQLRDATCDVCGAKAEINCRLGDDGQANRKLQSMGWSFVKRKHYCPTCERDRRKKSQSNGGSMKQKLSVKKPVSKPGAVETEARKPTRDQKREIMSLLETVYDTAAERYKQGDTDDSIADVLNVMPGWVAEIREEFFGPAGHNEDIDTLMKNLERLHADADAAMEQAAKSIAALKAIQKDAAAYKGDLSKVKRTLSPRHGIH